MLNRGSANFKAIICNALALILSHGIYNHVNAALFDKLDDICTSFMNFAYYLSINSH